MRLMLLVWRLLGRKAFSLLLLSGGRRVLADGRDGPPCFATMDNPRARTVRRAPDADTANANQLSALPALRRSDAG